VKRLADSSNMARRMTVSKDGMTEFTALAPQGL
jgi:hypothetical protein